MYLEYLVRLKDAPEGVLTPQNARSLLGVALQKSPGEFPSVLFGHDSEGRNIQTLYSLPNDHIHYAAPATVTVSGGQNFLRLTAVGPQGCEVLRAHIAQVAHAIGQLTQQPYSINVYSGDVGIQPSGPQMYGCSSFILQKNTKHLLRLLKDCSRDSSGRWDVDFDNLKPAIEKSLVRGLIGQALHLDHLLAGQSDSLMGQMPTNERLGVQVLEGTTYFYRTDKHRGLALAIRNLKFSMDAKLSGPWSAGQLRARGFGSIRPLSRMMAGGANE